MPFWVSGKSLSDQVHQTPAHLLTKAKSMVQLNCSHTIQDYYMILWYEHLKSDTALRLIGYVNYDNPSIESDFTNQSKIAGDGSKASTLHLKLENKLVGRLNTRNEIITGNNLHQTPKDLLEKSEESVTLSCSHTSQSIDMIVWYEQLKGDTALKLIGYLYYTNALIENQYIDDFDIKGHGKNASSLRFNVSQSSMVYSAGTAGYLICKDVQQSPTDVMCQPNTSVELTCRHQIKSYDTVLWYQKLYGDSSLKLIGYAQYSSIKEFENTFKDVLCEPNMSTELTCRHQINNYDTILWYRRLNNNSSLKLIGFARYSNVKELEQSFKGHFSLTGDGQSVVLSNKVDQSPSDIFWSPGSSAEVTCRHKISNYDTILWYQRSQRDSEMKLIGYMYYGERTIATKFEKHFNVSGHGETVSILHLVQLRKSEDSALYYCAAYFHSAASSASIKQKPSHLTTECNITQLHQTSYDLGVVLSNKVDQSPSDIFWSPGSSAEVTCRHQISNYDTILWYQRSQKDTELKLIGYMYLQQGTLEGTFKNHFNVSGHGKTHSTLYLIQLRQSEDSAMYYCAAYYHSGLSTSLGVTQSPTDLLLDTGATLNITCSHHDKTYDKIYWYQQTNEKSLELLGLLSFTKGNVDKEGFGIAGDAESEGYLLVSSVETKHTAVYFCAVSTAQC
ncbi:hypothetical protein E1301_Tti006319 [Triplophysa tibetana]|uniref:Ig-like domain-containing protein n=1 Tax=Triplophysa tibetana TaxID=1572043 RepID=A0A5A9NNU1_9TELE|nr:hypothetical protein E1301_Tti006319 [Triplophysa tibetana]